MKQIEENLKKELKCVDGVARIVHRMKGQEIEEKGQTIDERI